MIGQRPAQRDGVRGLVAGQPEPGGERHRVGQQAQRVPGRAHLDREQLTRGRGGRVDLVDDRQPAGQPVGHQHALVARHQHRADGRPGREQLPHLGGSLVVTQSGRHHRDERRPEATGDGGPEGTGTGWPEGRSAADSGSGGPTHTPAPPGVATPAASTRSRPRGGTVSGTVTTAVSTARNGASLASVTVHPAWRSTRRTSAAAPRSESADPFRPRVGTRPAARIFPPEVSTTSVVALPTSTPATTVTGQDSAPASPATPSRQRHAVRPRRA